MDVRWRQIVHDLRAPITSLNFLIQSGKTDPGTLGLVQQRLQDILAKAENFSQQQGPDWYPVRMFLKTIEDVIMERRAAGNLDFLVDRAGWSDSSMKLKFDPVDLKIIIDELVYNSVKYSGKKEKVITIQCEKIGARASLVVSDNGARLDSALFERLGSDSAMASGSGMGLPNMSRILQAWDGDVEFENSEHGLIVRLDFSISKN